ncbi:hypothetical protein ACJQWK_05875 [Exserohilum turcicum]
MNAQSSPINATVILRDENDYRTWYNQLQARCEAYKVWAQVDPDSTTTPLAEPSQPGLPDISDYTPSSALGEGRVPARLSDLSSSGQRAYKDDLEVYKLQIESYKLKHAAYKTESASLQHIVVLVQSTVAPHLQRTCCLPNIPLKQWIKNLKLEAGIAPKFEQEQTRNRYQNALKPPRSVNVWDLWLTEYSQAATEAEMLNVPEVSQINIITADFTSAVNKIAPIWAATFQATGKDQPGLSRKDMMRRFREYMTLNHPVTRGRSQKAAFMMEESSYLASNHRSTQPEGDAQQATMGNSQSRKRGRPLYQRTAEDDQDPSPSSLNYQSRGRLVSAGARSQSPDSARPAPSKLASTKVRSPSQGSTRARKITAPCPACDGSHSLYQCFYLDQKKAPSWWKPNQIIRNSIERKKENDLEFQSLIRAQSRPRTRSQTYKQSQTPQLEIED